MGSFLLYGGWEWELQFICSERTDVAKQQVLWLEWWHGLATWDLFLPWHKRLSNCYLRRQEIVQVCYFSPFWPWGSDVLCILSSSHNHSVWIEWIYFLIFLSFSICITCYMQWLPNLPSQLIVAPSNFHLSKRFYKFRNTAPLALAEILLIIGGLVYQCQELCKHRILAVIYNV